MSSPARGPRSSRRQVLTGLCAGLGLAPLLGAWLEGVARAEAEAASAASPSPLKRFVGVYAPHGVARELWLPGLDFDLRYEHCSLAPFDDPASFGRSFKDQLLIVDGLDLSAGIEAGTVGHEGARVMLTGSAADGQNASIDQFLAIECGLGSATPFSSLVLGVGLNQTDIGSNISYLRGGRPVPKRIDPGLVFDAVFGQAIAPGDPAMAARLAAERRRKQSSLDFLREQLTALSARLPRGEAQKLEQHLTAHRELERRLAHLEAACDAPARPPGFASVLGSRGAARDFDAITDLQVDLLVAALACDATRFATLFLNDLSRTRLLPGMPEDIHFEVSHLYRARDENQPGRPESWLPLARQNRYSYGKVARLLQRLDERDLLKETLVLVSSDMGDPSRHSSRNVPTLLAGAGIAGGRLLQVNGGRAARANNHLLVSICNAFGVPLSRFGEARDAAIVNGALPGLAAT